MFGKKVEFGKAYSNPLLGNSTPVPGDFLAVQNQQFNQPYHPSRREAVLGKLRLLRGESAHPPCAVSVNFDLFLEVLRALEEEG